VGIGVLLIVAYIIFLVAIIGTAAASGYSSDF